MKIFIVAAALTGLAAPAIAYDGQFVRDTCMSGDEKAESLCAGYATGLAQSLMLSNKFESPMGNFCEGSFQPQEAAAVLLEYLDANPEKHSEDAAGVMLQAMIDRFPCI